VPPVHQQKYYTLSYPYLHFFIKFYTINFTLLLIFTFFYTTSHLLFYTLFYNFLHTFIHKHFFFKTFFDFSILDIFKNVHFSKPNLLLLKKLSKIHFLPLCSQKYFSHQLFVIANFFSRSFFAIFLLTNIKKDGNQ